MIVARISLHGEEHLAIALSASDREAIQAGEITSLDLDKVLTENLDLLMAFDGKITKIALMTEEVLSQLPCLS
jgi:hypothetical protein